MLQKLGDHIAACLQRAADAGQRGAEANDPQLRTNNEMMPRVGGTCRAATSEAQNKKLKKQG
jgi:hypothetical protein